MGKMLKLLFTLFALIVHLNFTLSFSAKEHHIVLRRTRGANIFITALRNKRSDIQNENVELAAGVGGTVSSIIVLLSEYKLKTTGSGFDDGPFGLLGLTEGLSYLAILGIVGCSAFNKIKTGNGLPSGPGGILGTAEGLSYLASVLGLVVLYYQLTDYGFLDWYPFQFNV